MMTPGFGGSLSSAGLFVGNLVGSARAASWIWTARKAGAAFVAVGIDMHPIAKSAARTRVGNCMFRIECVANLHKSIRLHIAPVITEESYCELNPWKSEVGGLLRRADCNESAADFMMLSSQAIAAQPHRGQGWF
jgi:hypothetical protein